MLFVLIIIAICSAVAYYSNILIQHLRKWKKQGIKYHTSYPLIGSMSKFVFGKMPAPNFLQYLYTKFPNERYCAFFLFTQPVVLICDRELLKEITIRHFENFINHAEVTISKNETLMNKMLFSTTGQRWKDMRQVLSPAFTSHKIRAMMILMDECVQNLMQHFKNQDPKNIIPYESRDLTRRFGNDVIASTAFGATCDSFANENNEFLTVGREFTETVGKKFSMYIAYPRISRLLGVTIVTEKTADFFFNLVNKSIKLRKDQQIVRPDLVHLMMMARQGQLKYEDILNSDTEFSVVEESLIQKPSDHKTAEFLTNEDITAHAVNFYFGGFDTLTGPPAFLGYELAINPDVQSKLRQEILQKEKGITDKISYEEITGMKYLDMVVSEVLRKYPASFFTDRECNKDFVIKATRKGEVDIHVAKKDVFWVPIYAIHNDPEIWPNPALFDPERFNETNKKTILPGSYIPFGMGPRSCIASRFALLEMKLLYYNLLQHFEIVPVKDTQIPLKLKPLQFNVAAEKDIQLGLKAIA